MGFYKEIDFQETEIGKIPKEWSVVNLHNVVDSQNDIVAGPFGSNLKVVDYRQEGVPIIRLQNIERNEFINKDIKYTSQKKAEELIYHSYKPGDIVLAKLGDPLGKTCIIPDYMEEGIVVADVVRIRISPKKTVNKFIEYILNSSNCSNQLYKETIGSTRPRVNISQIRNLKIPLPSLSEQRQIASILSRVDDDIQKTDEIIQKTQLMKKGLMQELLTKGIGHMEFKYSEELGCEIPNEWETDYLGKVCEKRQESIIPKGDGIPFIGLEHIESGQTYLKGYPLDYELKSMKSKFYPNDILYGKLRPYLDKAVLADMEGICSTDILVFKPIKEKLDPRFLVYLIHTNRFISHSVSSTSGTNHPRTSWQAIKRFLLAIPPITEQNQIATILSRVDDQIEKERQTKEQLEKLKKGLMRIFLTGQVRAKVK